jgi:hypothetical protein
MLGHLDQSGTEYLISDLSPTTTLRRLPEQAGTAVYVGKASRLTSSLLPLQEEEGDSRGTELLNFC